MIGTGQAGLKRVGFRDQAPRDQCLGMSIAFVSECIRLWSDGAGAQVR